MKGEVRRTEQNIEKYGWGVPGRQGEREDSLGTGSTMPIIQGMGTKGMGAGMGKGANVPLVTLLTLLIRVWILGPLKAYSPPA